MKKIIIVALLILLQSCFEEPKSYCGKVIEKYRTDAGYKSSPQWHIVYYCDSLKKNIDVQVTPNTYANIYIGKYTCFNLVKFQLR
jgi:hypothetical protein